nr:DUF417 family protein [uncultured Bradyrhizobium sp.]
MHAAVIGAAAGAGNEASFPPVMPRSERFVRTWTHAQAGRNCLMKGFNVAESGDGSYRLLAILRWVMVIIFVSFGMQKFTPQSAQGIAQFISNSPFISWLSVFGLRGEAYVLGVAEFVIAALLAAGAFNPVLSALGSLMGVVTFAITWSFFFTTPGVVKWSLSSDPMAWNLTGEFLFKDIVLLGVCVVLLLASLPQTIVRLRMR